MPSACARLLMRQAGSALVIDDVVEGAGAIEQGSHQPAFLPVGVLHAASAFGELGMRTRFACALGKEQGTAETLGGKAIGMLEREGRMHAQAFGAVRGAIGIARHLLVPMRVEGNSGDALPVRHRLIDVPEVVGRISGDMGGVLIESDDSTLEERTKRGDIGSIERQGVLSEGHIAIHGVSAGSDARAIAKEADLFLFRGAIGLFLVTAFLDAESAVRVAFGKVGQRERVSDVDIGGVLAHPGSQCA